MNTNFDIITLIFLTLYVILNLVKNLSLVGERNFAKNLITFELLTVLVCLIVQVLYIVDQLTLTIFMDMARCILIGLYGALFTRIIALKIYPYTKQKIKVLWRVPLIALLVGYYFELKYLPFLCGGYLLIAVGILLRNYKEYRVIVPNVLLYILPILGMIYFFEAKLWIFNIIVFVILILSQSLWHYSIANMLFKIKESRA